MDSRITKGLDEHEKRKIAQKTISETKCPQPMELIYLNIDQYSLSGFEDKISFILAPSLAALGIKVLVIYGLSYNSPTSFNLCKLESIGFRVFSNLKETYDNIGSTGCCIVGEKEEFAPMDEILSHCKEIKEKNIYHPFIIAGMITNMSSQKITALVYNLKYGQTSIFNSKEEAEKSATNLLSSKNVKASALLTSVENILGEAIGDCLEVAEVVDCLRGKGPSDVVELACVLGSELLHIIRGTTKREGKNMVLKVLRNGKALEKFKSMIICQGVKTLRAEYLCNGESFTNIFCFTPCLYRRNICLRKKGGYIQEINLVTLTKIYQEIVKRNCKCESLGLMLLKNVGDKIRKEEAWVAIHQQRQNWLHLYEEDLLNNAITVGKSPKKRILIGKIIFHSNEFLLMEENYS